MRLWDRTKPMTATGLLPRRKVKILKLRKLIGISIVAFMVGGGIALASPPPPAIAPPPETIVVAVAPVVEVLSVVVRPLREPESPSIVFRHGDISWLPQLATEAGWPRSTWKKLGHIILRESGGCPGRIGGDRVDKNCNVTEVVDWSHRSDSGLLQINWQNYDSKRIGRTSFLCGLRIACTQAELLDPLVNLVAGRALFAELGWGPWDPCQWGPKYKRQCRQTRP